MIIILPFVLALVSCIYAMRGRRGAALAWLTATLVVNLWCDTDVQAAIVETSRSGLRP